MEIEEGKAGVKVCVTGGGGYIGSWLVKNLLQRGYTVNATLRDPKNEAKFGPLLSLPGAAERLKLFQADLWEEHAFDSAVEGCQGVFHVASPMDFTKLSEEDFVEPAVKGVMNLLNACSRAKSVRRFIYTSSIAAAAPLNEEGELLSGYSLDESRWTPVDFMRRKHQHPLGFYFVAKTLAEQAAIEYGLNSEMEVLTISPSNVCGPCITSTFPVTCRVVVDMVELGNSELLGSITLLGSIALVHIDDVCEAHIFLMEQPNVEGRHICSAFSLTVSQLADIIHKIHPQCTLPFKKIMKISKDERADIRNMLVGMSKKVYNEIVKEMDIIASHDEPYQQQHASNKIKENGTHSTHKIGRQGRKGLISMFVLTYKEEP